MTDKLPRTLPVPPDSASGAIALDRIMDALRRTIPDRPARSLHRIAIGLSTLVVGNDEVVCRVPLNNEAATAQERLSGLLPLLARRLPAPIPIPLRTIPATDGLRCARLPATTDIARAARSPAPPGPRPCRS